MSTQRKAVVVFDESHGQRRWGETGFPPHTVDGSYSLVAESYHFDYDFKASVEKLTKRLLRGVDVLVVASPVGRLNTDELQWEPTPDCQFSDEEIDAISHFVTTGGGLLLLAHRHQDDFTKSNMNRLAERFGFSFRSTVVWNLKPSNQPRENQWHPITSRLVPHPITQKIQKLLLKNCCTIDIHDDEICHGIIFPPIDSIETDLRRTQFRAQDYPAVVASYSGYGRVVACGSDRLFSEEAGLEFEESQNLPFARNILQFLGSRDPVIVESDFKPRLFVSHHSGDKEFARRLANDLRERAMDVWFDEFELVVGDSLTASIDRGITESDFFVLLISRNALQSNWVQQEYCSANARMLAGGQLTILPLRLDDSDVPTLLGDTVYADFRSNYDSAFAQLVDSIERHIERRKTRIIA